jgi:hypothetical protein
MLTLVFDSKNSKDLVNCSNDEDLWNLHTNSSPNSNRSIIRFKNLNDSQAVAVNRVLENIDEKDYSINLIHGPPGKHLIYI